MTKAFCFVNGQFKHMGQVIRKIAWEQTDCILITPGWPKYWVSMLNDLPIAKTVTIDPEKVVTGGQRTQESLFVRGSRATTVQPGAATVYWKLYAHLVEYSTLPGEHQPKLRQEEGQPGSGAGRPAGTRFGPMRHAA